MLVLAYLIIFCLFDADFLLFYLILQQIDADFLVICGFYPLVVIFYSFDVDV